MKFLHNTISEAFLRKNPATIKSLIAALSAKFGIDILPNTLSHILLRDSEIKSCRGVPMDEERVKVKKQTIADYFQLLFHYLEGIPAAFITNMDEVGHSERADAQEKVVYVPSDFPNEKIPIPIPRSSKRVTLVATIALDGSIFTPMIIIPRKTIDSDCSLLGDTQQNCVIAHLPRGFMEVSIFDK
jgi:hypothetical protein